MLPHPRGEAESIVAAFHECTLGLHDIRPEHLDESASSWVRTLEELMDDQGIRDSQGQGTWRVKAEKMTDEEKLALSKAVDELANWFDRKAAE